MRVDDVPALHETTLAAAMGGSGGGGDALDGRSSPLDEADVVESAITAVMASPPSPWGCGPPQTPLSELSPPPPCVISVTFRLKEARGTCDGR